MGGAATLAAVVALAAAAATATAQPQPPAGWDGVNPFRCTVQQAGFGTAVPDPAADPYCVEFDKRRQNVTELGIADFLSKEPARLAAASGKCFYFQVDHWRASVVQDDGSTKLYEWDGHYFFDKATGDGGAWVTNFNINGQTGDPSAIPGIPPEFAQHLGPGTGGAITRDATPADPACAARAAAEHDAIYAGPAAAPGPHGCPDPGAGVDRRRLGRVHLRAREADVRAALGDPREVRRGFLRYCAAGGGALLVGEPGDRSGAAAADPHARVAMVVTTAPGLLAARPSARGARTVLRAGAVRVVALRGGVLAGIRAHHVRFIAVRDRTIVRSRRALRRWLVRAGTFPSGRP